MHGTIMIFAFMMPVFVGLANYVVPLLIAARDMAFPRLNAASFWLFVAGALVLAMSLLIGVAPDAGWFAYAPLTEAAPRCFSAVGTVTTQLSTYNPAIAAAQGQEGCFAPTPNIDFWVVAPTFLTISSILTGLSFMVWAHHMFVVGLPPIAQMFFAATSTLIAIPTGVKIFNWIATMWGGRVRFTTAMLFAIGFIVQFMVGGLSGVSLSVVPFDYQVTDTYYLVAHLHYVLPAGALMALFAGLYYWFPKMSGRMLDERLGTLQFWVFIVGTNLTFFPMHLLGLFGMPRRIYTYADHLGLDGLKLTSSIGAYLLAVGVLIFIANWFITVHKPANAPADPWDAFTLEWATSSPPPPEDFETIPPVRSARPVWDAKHPEKADYRSASGWCSSTH